MSSTQRGGSRLANDYYKTPVSDIIRFLLSAVPYIPDLLSGRSILDPACGGDIQNYMSYPEALVMLGIPEIYITALDIRKDSRATIIQDYLQYECQGVFDLIITNPPFLQALEFIQKALSDIKPNGYVVMLLRLNFFGSAKRFPFWQEHLPNWIFVHSKRISFTPDKRTDSIEYMHAVWKGQKKVDFSKLLVI